MTTVPSEQVIFCDVDETLIMWGNDPDNKYPVSVTFSNPYSPGESSTVRVHFGHVRILKDRHARGACIFVWSAGGYKWAQAVVEALGLQNYVQYCMSKPIAYLDDKEANQFMGERIYLGPSSAYGTKK